MAIIEHSRGIPSPNTSVSIILCTRNRRARLALALSSLDNLVIPPGIILEIILVDNGSTDETATLVQAYAARSPERFRYVFEANKGKSIALNTGILSARGQILAFTDDDCIVDPCWIEAILNAFHSDEHPDVVGGRVELYNPMDAAITLAAGSAKVEFSNPKQLFPDPLIIGANLAVKSDVLRSIGGFDILLGPGTAAISEDVDFIYRAFANGFKIIYYPSILIYHNHGRQTERELTSLSYRYNTGRGAFYFKHLFSGDFRIARMLIADLTSSTFRLFTLKGVRFELTFLRAIFSGGLSRLTRRKAR